MRQELSTAYEQAGIKEGDLMIRDVRLLRNKNVLCIRAAKSFDVDSERLKLWEKGICNILHGYSVEFSYEKAEVQTQAVQHTAISGGTGHLVEAEIPENGIILGSKINTKEITNISEINSESGTVTICGTLVSSEMKEGWANKLNNGKDSFRVSFNVTDQTNSIYAQAIFGEEWKAKRFMHWLSSADKAGKSMLVRGACKETRFNKETTLYANDVMLVDRKLRMDDGVEKRVELHLHSRMSTMDGLTNLTQAFETAKRWGHKALAITDHGVVQAFPEAAKAAKKTGVKAIFGVEGYLVADTILEPMGAEYVVFDLETTGLKAEQCEILEIGAVKLQNGEVTDRFHTFINEGAVIPKNIRELTGITPDMLTGAPSLYNALLQFSQFCGDCCLAAHNARFDIGFLSYHGNRVGIDFSQPYADTLMLSRYLLRDELENHKLDTICEHFNIDMGSHHRADDDAASCAKVLLKLMELLKSRGVTTLPVIVEKHKKRREKQKSYHIVLLAKTQAGMKNLYKLISYSHLDHFRSRPLIPRSMLSVFREGLIVGSACEAGELYRAVLDGEENEELEKIASFYDYLEIQPNGNNAFLVRENRVKDEEELCNINRRIVELGERLSIPVAATGDVHFLEPEDAVYRKILMYKMGFSDAELQAPLYFKTTTEMLQDFAYLGEEKAHEVVIKTPNMIAALCENLKPFPDGTHSPVLENAEEELKKTAMECAHKVYGDELPDIVKARLDRELKSIIGNGYASLYLMARKLVQKSLGDGYLVGSRGSVGSSLVATMAGITEVNPLPPHYICPNCRYSDFDVDKSLYSVGVDMPDKICPNCKTLLKKEGFEIPFEVFLGFEGDKIPDIDLNFSGEYQPTAHKFVEEMLGKGHAFRAGTISGIAERKGYECVYHYAEESGRTLNRAETERLCKGCLNVKVTTGQHPGGIVVVPKEAEIYDFTPIQYPADKVDGKTITTHFDFHAMDDRLVKLDILGHDDPTALRMLQDLTGLNPREIPLDDPETRNIFHTFEPLGIDLSEMECSVGSLGVPEFGTGFVRQVLEATQPKTMEELVRIAGLTHGTDVWLNNAEPLVRNKIAKLNEVLCTRDDIMNYLIAHGMEAALSFKIMERVRKGRGLTDEMEHAMKEGKIPAWFIDSCKKIQYMFPRGHAVAYTMMAFRIAYYKVHYPIEFYAVYFTVRADAFDITKALGTPEQLLATIRELERSSQSKEAAERKKDKELQTILEVVYEMSLRGIKMLPVDIYKSDAVKFRIEGGALRPPFNAVSGIGTTAAVSMASKRGNGKFISIQDFAERTGANSGVIASLKDCGCFADLPQSNQISLFDF
ncbi:MAG: PolC-type DNA polymerase III [Clostridia bacterium]|nr:PolC-type DNA polymerase III [Clostridia bacterium]